MYLDRLHQVERDALAPRQEHLFDEIEDEGVHREALDLGRAREERAEACGARAVEGALAERRRGEAWLKVDLDAGDEVGIDRAAEHAPAVARERSGLAFHRGAHAGTRASACG